MNSEQRDGRVLRGQHTRKSALLRAVEIASVEGLDGLSMGRLATELRVSKSGVFAHFGSKEELQVAVVHAATEIFVARIIEPALRTPPGIGRLWRLCEAWMAASLERVSHGGCFFFNASAE